MLKPLAVSASVRFLHGLFLIRCIFSVSCHAENLLISSSGFPAPLSASRADTKNFWQFFSTRRAYPASRFIHSGHQFLGNLVWPLHRRTPLLRWALPQLCRWGFWDGDGHAWFQKPYWAGRHTLPEQMEPETGNYPACRSGGWQLDSKSSSKLGRINSSNPVSVRRPTRNSREAVWIVWGPEGVCSWFCEQGSKNTEDVWQGSALNVRHTQLLEPKINNRVF